jgi:hypothetical protein
MLAEGAASIVQLDLAGVQGRRQPQQHAELIAISLLRSSGTPPCKIQLML